MLSEVTEEMRQSCRLCSRSSRWKREDEWAPFMYLIRLLCIECHVPGKELGIPSKFPWNCKIAVRSSRRGRGQGGHGEKFSSKFLHSVFWIQPLFFSWLWSSQSRESHMSLTVSSRGPCPSFQPLIITEKSSDCVTLFFWQSFLLAFCCLQCKF